MRDFRKELREILNGESLKGWSIRKRVVSDEGLLAFVMEQTNFLIDTDELKYPLLFRIRVVIDGMTAIPKCPTCGKDLIFLKSKMRFQNHCCPHCALTNEVAQRKREETCLRKYGVRAFNNHEKQEATMLARYGVCSALSESIFREKGRRTKIARYGSANYSNPEKATATCKARYGTGRNNAKVMATMVKRYGVRTYLLSREVNSMRNCKAIQARIIETKRRNHTFRVSAPEERCYAALVQRFGENDVVRQFRSEKYPFLCDFYIKSLDLYIEYQGHWSHGHHPFNPNDPLDLETVKKWEGRGSAFYKKAIWVWTKYDVGKRTYATQGHLNFKEFWSEKDFLSFTRGEEA